MELWEFENIVLDWCFKHNLILKEVRATNKDIEIHTYYTVQQSYGLKKTYHECYHCCFNDDMTLKNVPHGMKGKTKGKKIILMEE